VFEDSCSLLDITLSLKSLNSSDEAAKLFEKWQSNSGDKPECVFVDLNIIGSSFDGIELIRKINFEYGNNVVIGIISSSNEPEEQAKAIQSGAQFWIIKSDEIEPRLEEFRKDYEGYNYAEIGQITGLNESQVKVYLHRARLLLRDYLVKIENVI
jgi:CheY-like chemotaxis protein